MSSEWATDGRAVLGHVDLKGVVALMGDGSADSVATDRSLPDEVPYVADGVGEYAGAYACADGACGVDAGAVDDGMVGEAGDVDVCYGGGCCAVRGADVYVG